MFQDGTLSTNLKSRLYKNEKRAVTQVTARVVRITFQVKLNEKMIDKKSESVYNMASDIEA